MKNDKWIIDAIAVIGLVLVFMTDLTGFALHEWIGIAIAGLLLIHFLQHWEWVISTSQRLTKMKGKVLSRYLVDSGLMVGFSIITITGLAISSLLSLPLESYETWRVVHVIASYATVFFLVIKLVLHWEMIAKMLKKTFGVDPQSMTPVQQKRRRFLRGFGVTAMAGLFVAAEIKEWQNKTGTYLQSSSANTDETAVEPTAAQTAESEAVTSTAQDELGEVVDSAVPTQNTIVESTESVEPTIQPTTEPTLQPTLAPTASSETVAVTGVVKCHKGCSYPGRCGRYYDDNQNGKCDLGEPIW